MEISVSKKPCVGQRRHNVGNLAIEVVGQNWSSEVIALFLKDWEVGRVALSCHLSMDLFMPRNDGYVQGELRVAGLSLFTVLNMVCLWNEGVLSFLLCDLVV